MGYRGKTSYFSAAFRKQCAVWSRVAHLHAKARGGKEAGRWAGAGRPVPPSKNGHWPGEEATEKASRGHHGGQKDTAGSHGAPGKGLGAWPRAAPYLQHGHLLSVAKQSEGQGVLGVQARDHVTAAQRNRNDVGLEIGPVLVEDELVILDSAPALPPAAVGEHVEVACEGAEGRRSARGSRTPTRLQPALQAPREADSPPHKPLSSCSLRILSDG